MAYRFRVRKPMPLRAPTVIEQHLELLSDEITREDDWHYAERLRGAADALRWMLEGGRAPVSWRPLRSPDRVAVYSEQAWAGEVETGIRELPNGMVTEYASGVFSALAWGSEDTDLPPG